MSQTTNQHEADITDERPPWDETEPSAGDQEPLVNGHAAAESMAEEPMEEQPGDEISLLCTGPVRAYVKRLESAHSLRIDHRRCSPTKIPLIVDHRAREESGASFPDEDDQVARARQLDGEDLDIGDGYAKSAPRPVVELRFDTRNDGHVKNTPRLYQAGSGGKTTRLLKFKKKQLRMVEYEGGIKYRDVHRVDLESELREFCKSAEKSKAPRELDPKYWPFLHEAEDMAEWFNEAGQLAEYSPLQRESKEAELDPGLLPRWADESKEGQYWFWSADGCKLLAIQRKRYNGAGARFFTFHTPWKNAAAKSITWKRVEPPEGLPIYGLQDVEQYRTIWLHEGAGAARHMQRLLAGEGKGKYNGVEYEGAEALAEHPWTHDIQLGVHVGWAGGAPSAYRTQWAELAKLKPGRVIIVPDNDKPGRKAVAEIARHLQAECWAVEFPQSENSGFKHGFDMADEWAECNYKKDKHGRAVYSGLMLDDVLEPATWAVKAVGRNEFDLTEHFDGQWVHIEAAGCYVHRELRHRVYDGKGLAKSLRRFREKRCDVVDLIDANQQSHILYFGYRPGDTALEYHRSWGQMGPGKAANMWSPARYTSDPERWTVVDWQIWLDYLEHLVPDAQDRFNLMQWLATLIAHPEVRMHWSVALISATLGTGKSTLGVIMEQLVGEHNFGRVNEKQLGSNFNTYGIYKTLCWAEEVYGGKEGRRNFNNLKDALTATKIMVERKYHDAQEVENHLHMCICTNSDRGVKLEGEDDRRWFVPQVSEALWLDAEGKSRFDELYAGVNGPNLLSAIKTWAQVFCEEHGHVKPGVHAPNNERKRAIVDSAMSDGDNFVYELVEHVKGLQEPTAVFIADVRHVAEQVQEKANARLGFYMTPNTIMTKFTKTAASDDGKGQLYKLVDPKKPAVALMVKAGKLGPVVLNEAAQRAVDQMQDPREIKEYARRHRLMISVEMMDYQIEIDQDDKARKAADDKRLDDAVNQMQSPEAIQALQDSVVHKDNQPM